MDNLMQLNHDFERNTWSDNDVIKLRSKILLNALAHLANSKVSQQNKTAILRWVRSEQVLPFSFVTCCYAVGLNPAILRTGVMKASR